MTDSLIGYGLIDAVDPDTKEEYGVSFLMSTRNQTEIEEYFTWFKDAKRQYSEDDKYTFMLLYDDLHATNSEVIAGLEHQMEYRNTRDPKVLGYHTMKWEQVRDVLDNMKQAEVDNAEVSPFSILTYEIFQ